MRSYLTQRIFRLLINDAFYTDSRCQAMPWSNHCLRKDVPRTTSSPLLQRRTIFGFSRKPTRQPKPAVYDPGIETMVELDTRLKMGARTPSAPQLVQAFVDFMAAKKGIYTLENIQVEHVMNTFLHLQRTCKAEDGSGLSTEDLRNALVVLRMNKAGDGQRGQRSSQVNKLARILYDELKQRKETVEKGEDSSEQTVLHRKDLTDFIRVMARYGDALFARQLTLEHWISHLVNSEDEKSIWLAVAGGILREGRPDELEKTIRMMQHHGVPFDAPMHQVMVRHYTVIEPNLAMAKRWYTHPIADNRPPLLPTDVRALKLCMHKKDPIWGDTICKSMMERHGKTSVDLMFQWAAFKGRGVDEIEEMIKIVMHKDKRKGCNVDMETINGLVSSSDDPYTAERFILMGQKLGFQPTRRTLQLQLDYRIRAKDLGGALITYNLLRGEDLSDNADIPYINKLIVAFCEERSENFEAIMGLVEDLTERKAPFDPETVAALSLLHLQRGEIDDLLDLLNTHTFHFGSEQRDEIRNVLRDFCRDPATSITQAWETYNILRQVFTETDIPTRVNLMENFFDRGRPDMATHIFGHMRQSLIKSQRPTVDTYASCLEGIAQAGDSESLGTVHNMIKLDNEIEPNTKLHTALMLAYTGCGNAARALDFWEDIVHSREGPSYASIQIAFQSCEKAPFGERSAKEIWQKLQKYDVEPTREIFAAYIGALAGCGLFDECVQLIDTAEKELGMKVDALMLGSFYNATRGNTKKQKVKQWAWKAYPEAYEDLMKLGQYEVVQGDFSDEDEQQEQFWDRETFFNIGPIGRDVKA